MNRDELLKKANELPMSPGVYIMKDKNGKVIYVGKSKKLHNRVSQYFQMGEKNLKTAHMVQNVFEFEYIVCSTEIEALSLENTLIKRYTPHYNIRLKDAKSYPYIKLTSGEYPRFVITRQREGDKAIYYGPYSGTGTAFPLLRLINQVAKLPTCHHTFPLDIGHVRPCIYYQMGRCTGVCRGDVTPSQYHEQIEKAKMLLRGNSAGVKEQLNKEMQAYADKEQYEYAAKCRDTLKALDAVLEKQHVVSDIHAEEDVIAFFTEESGCGCISVLRIREGRLVDKNEWIIDADTLLNKESVLSFLFDYYGGSDDIPDMILLSIPLEEEDNEVMMQLLREQSGHVVSIRQAVRGEGRALVDMALTNAKEKTEMMMKESSKNQKVLLDLAHLLGLPSVPRRIESYDISNWGDECLTAGMVVMQDGKMQKSDYRLFRVKDSQGRDDYAAMRETLDRRLTHWEAKDRGFDATPDLILLDGGVQHVSVIHALLQEKGWNIPVFGMVKDEYHKTRALCSHEAEISIAKNRDVYLLLYRLQEEVHRFTVTSMTNAKRKTVRHSSLEKIPGIGPAKAKVLLKDFGGLREIKNATEEKIGAVSGISRENAHDIYCYFHK